MNNFMKFGVNDAVVDGLANALSMLRFDPIPQMTKAEVAWSTEDLADTFAKQIKAQRDIMINRLPSISACQQSVVLVKEATLTQDAIELCDQLGYSDWREHNINTLRSVLIEQLKSARHERFRAEIHRLVAQGELMIEISPADHEVRLLESTVSSN